MDKAFSFMLIFFGGGLGCLARFFIDGTELHAFSIANLTSCALMGVCYAMFNYSVLADHKFFHTFVNVGFLGGLSTFTPLAVYSLVSTEHNVFIASAMLCGILVVYSILSIATYFATAFVLKKYMHKHRRMSLLCRYRFLVQYKMIIPRFAEIKALADELYASGLNLNDKKPLPGVFEEKRNVLRQKAYDYVRMLLAFTEMYKEAMLKDKCHPHSLEDMLVDAVAKGDLGSPEHRIETIKPQLDYINKLMEEITPKALRKGK